MRELNIFSGDALELPVNRPLVERGGEREIAIFFSEQRACSRATLEQVDCAIHNYLISFVI